MSSFFAVFIQSMFLKICFYINKYLLKNIFKISNIKLQAVDKDQSGEISQQEFRLFFQCLGLTHDVSRIAHFLS